MADFKEHIQGAGLIRKNPGISKGIPQGSPISAILSNLYMIDFDLAVMNFVLRKGGLYRRYCDDIICIIPIDSEASVDSLVMAEIDKVKLQIQPEKTGKYWFVDGNLSKGYSTYVQYLGLTFDGKNIRIRPGSVSRYYSKLRAAVSLARQTRKKHDKLQGVETCIKKKKLRIKYSYIGRRNFVSYAIKASSIAQSAAIKSQIKRHWYKLENEIAFQENVQV